MTQKRIEWIDIVKGCAIILVVMGHVTSSYHAAGLYQLSVLLNFSSQLIYSFHMATFMLISGALFRNKPNKKNQIRGILLNYGVPYLTFSCVWWGFKMVLNRFVNTGLTIRDLILIPIFPISFMWFIYALMLMEILQVIVGDHTNKGKIIQLGIGLILYFIHPLLAKVQISSTDYHFSDMIISDLMAYYLYFSIGVCYGKELILWIKKCKRALLGVCGGTLLLSNAIIYKQGVACGSIVKLLMAFCGTTFLLATCVEKRNKVLSFIGRRTLPVYVLHGLCIATLRILLGRMGLNDDSGIIPLIICTILGTAIPVGVYEISKRVGHLDFFFTPGKYIKYEGDCDGIR